MARFPDSRIVTTYERLPKGLPPARAGLGRSVTGPGFWTRNEGPGTRGQAVASLPADSGGTVWDLHPLRVAAGVSVRLSNRPTQAGRGEYNTLGPNGLPRVQVFRNIT